MTPTRSRAVVVPTEDIEDTDPGLARERTGLAWTRTAISFAALGGAILKTTPPAGVLVLGMSALVWGLGRISHRSGRPEATGRHRHLLITVTVTLVSVVALAIVLMGAAVPQVCLSC
jgi:uncharacterized membrane protein YidH (DUF202 family)